MWSMVDDNRVLRTPTRSTMRIIWLAKLSFWLGLVVAILGSVITFYPGSECYWFLTAGLLLAPGIFVPKAEYRIVAIPACALCLVWGYLGYHCGIDYQQWLQSRPVQETSRDRAKGE